MKTLLAVLVVFVVGAMLAPAQAQVEAQVDPGSTEIVSVGGVHGAFQRLAHDKPSGGSYVPLPGQFEPEPGPTAAGSAFLPSWGRAIVRPTGGSFVSPKQQADREIQRLIRKLG
jgi:hypothetical protein